MITNKKRVEVLVASLNKNPQKLISDMNVSTDVVVANQSQDNTFEVLFSSTGCRCVFINSSDRGVGKNRNLGIIKSHGDYLIFADDDVVFYDDYEEMVINEFLQFPKADAVIFEIEYKNRISSKKGRLNWYETLKYGTVRIAIKRESLMKANIWFSLLFGGGASYSNGEDTLFIQDMFKKKLKVYKSNKVLCKVSCGNSTWFSGYTDKFFEDRGILLFVAFPHLFQFFFVYYAFKYAQKSRGKKALDIYKLMINGTKKFKTSEVK